MLELTKQEIADEGFLRFVEPVEHPAEVVILVLVSSWMATVARQQKYSPSDNYSTEFSLFQ